MTRFYPLLAAEPHQNESDLALPPWSGYQQLNDVSFLAAQRISKAFMPQTLPAQRVLAIMVQPCGSRTVPKLGLRRLSIPTMIIIVTTVHFFQGEEGARCALLM
jgi:hypothetical protein